MCSILRGGSDAACSNKAIVQVIREGLVKENLPETAVLLVEDTNRAHVTEMLRMNSYIDVLIPRGGKGLIDHVVKNSTVPGDRDRNPGIVMFMWTNMPIFRWR